MKYHRGPTPSEEFHRVKRITLMYVPHHIIFWWGFEPCQNLCGDSGR